MERATANRIRNDGESGDRAPAGVTPSGLFARTAKARMTTVF